MLCSAPFRSHTAAEGRARLAKCPPKQTPRQIGQVAVMAATRLAPSKIVGLEISLSKHAMTTAAATTTGVL